jgi:2-methylisocitrate lyase-like PEP mutase family enzyme
MRGGSSSDRADILASSRATDGRIAMTGATELRALLRAEAMVIAPGAYDGLTAKLVAQAGFPAVYMTGAGTSVSHGYPDFGLLTMSEMVDNAARIVRSVDVPVIADADTGYGNELNVFRTVQEYERRGVAGIHIEDQMSPKKCGHLDDKEIVSRDDYIAKIRAAVAARRDRDFLIIARTDARAVAGLDEAVTRANAALAAGADMAFVEAPQTMEELAAVPKLVAGQCLLNVVRGGKTPEIELADAERMGYAIAIVPGLLLGGILSTCDRLLADLKQGKFPPVSGSPAQSFARFGAAEWDERRTAFRDPVNTAAKAAAE